MNNPGTAGEPTDSDIRKSITGRLKDGHLSCAQAFDAAAELGIPPGVVGRYADEMAIRLNRCQLGLFGYYPEKKIVERVEPVDSELQAAITAGLRGGRLACAAAWQIADRMGLQKMDVSGACETLGIKIKPCQLGAF